MNMDYSLMSDEELLSVLVMDNKVGASLYSKFGDLKSIVMDASDFELSQIYGLGEKRILQLRALKELSKRVYQPSLAARYKIKSPQDIYDLVYADIAYEDKRCFGTILLNTRLQVIRNEIISIGTVGTALLDQRLVFTPAIKKSASRVVIYTNESAGSCTPEQLDRDLSKKMIEAGLLLGIPLIDYVLIAPGEYFSFKENGML